MCSNLVPISSVHHVPASSEDGSVLSAHDCIMSLLTLRILILQLLAERDLAGSVIFSLFGPGLTGNVVRERAEAMFYELDQDGSGGLTADELQDWFSSVGATLTDSAVADLMKGNVEDPERGIQLSEFQQLVYIVYQIKS